MERLEQILLGEKNTHARPLLVRALTKALEKTRETKANLEAAANDKAAAEASKPAKAKPAKDAE